MRWILGIVMGLVLAAAHAQTAATKVLTPEQYRAMSDDREYWRQQHKRYEKIWERALDLMPERRNTPLRELNISDNEVREVQAIAALHLPRALVNISPVVTDCPCEEGPTCTAQVYVLATSKGKTSGLQLSRMNQTWGVGVVQQWWLKRAAIRRQTTGNTYLDDYLEQKALNELIEEFPVCVGQLVPASQIASTAKAPQSRQEKK
jgi:hypothetical protein